MPRLAVVLNALVALAVVGVVLLGGHGDAVAFALTDANGALALTNSHAGAAIFDGEGLRPGVPVNGSVTIGNTGAAQAELAIAATAESDAPGAGGGDLWSALQLRISDFTDPAAPVVLYDGPLAQLGRRDLRALAVGAARTYLLTAELPPAGGDAFQGARLSLGFAWTAQGASPATATPTAAPPVAPTADPTAGGLVTMPAATACVKRRTLALRLKRPPGVTVTAVTVKVARGRARRVKGTRVVLRRLPARGRYTVTVTTRLAGGRTLKTARTYRACTTSR
jgi:spore coat-associated protein N